MRWFGIRNRTLKCGVRDIGRGVSTVSHLCVLIANHCLFRILSFFRVRVFPDHMSMIRLILTSQNWELNAGHNAANWIGKEAPLCFTSFSSLRCFTSFSSLYFSLCCFLFLVFLYSFVCFFTMLFRVFFLRFSFVFFFTTVFALPNWHVSWVIEEFL